MCIRDSSYASPSKNNLVRSSTTESEDCGENYKEDTTMESNENVALDEGRVLLFEQRKRRPRHRVQEDDWTYKKAKIAREKGESYQGRQRAEDEKIQFIVTKPKRRWG